jgi:hypothetical protein
MIGVDLGAPFITPSVRYTKAHPPGCDRPCTRRAVSGLLNTIPCGRRLLLTCLPQCARSSSFQYLIGSVALSILGALFRSVESSSCPAEARPHHLSTSQLNGLCRLSLSGPSRAVYRLETSVVRCRSAVHQGGALYIVRVSIGLAWGKKREGGLRICLPVIPWTGPRNAAMSLGNRRASSFA